MTLIAGTKLGSYEILAPLGAGGMGEVYRARDSKLDRDVAVKVLPASVAEDADALSRFEREAKAVAALSHPNILAIYDFGRHDGVAYAVTELLDGDTLRGKLDAGPVSQKQAIDWSLQIAKGLSAAHERGIVHRDLKPENVFVTKDGHVKILDFGLAKRVEPAAPGKQTSAPTGSGHTEPGTVMGTMGYMSPEQVKGQPVDHRSDIFSFGALLYELLSGTRAFKRDTSAETIVAILTQEPPELTGSGRNISPALDHVVRHALEKEPGNRFQSAKDVAFALSEASGSTSTTATSGVQPVAAPQSGKKWPIVAVAVAVVLAAAAAFLFSRRPHGSPAAPGGAKRVAVLPFENLGSADDDYFADGISDEIRGKLTALPGVEVIARASCTPYKKTTKTPRQIAEELNANYLLTATLRWETSAGAKRVHVSPELVDMTRPDNPVSKWQQGFDAALTDVFQVQSDIASQTAQALGVALGTGAEKQLAERPTKNLAAYEAFLKGVEAGGAKTDPATLRKEAGFYEQAVALDPGFAQAWAAMAVTNSLLYANSTPSPGVAERARVAAEKAMALAPNEGESYRALGFYKKSVLADLPGGLEEFKKGRQIAPGNVNLMRNEASAEMSLGNWNRALELMQEVRRVDPRSVSVHRLLGTILVYLRRYSEARAALDAALALSPDDVSVIGLHVISWLGEGNLDAARADVATFSKTVEPTELLAHLAYSEEVAWVFTVEQQQLLLRLTPAAFDDDRGSWGLRLAQVLWWKGDNTSSRKYAEEAQNAFAAQLRNAPDNAFLRGQLGLTLALLGRADDAVRECQRGVELAAKDSVNEPGFLLYLAESYAFTGQPEKAVETLERVLRVPYPVSRAWLTIDPNFDPIRKNPRFQKLVAKTK